jgi:hypothetical protein
MFFLRSLVLTIFSPSFYVEAVNKGLKKGFLVYFLFTLLMTAVTFIIFAVGFGADLLQVPEKLANIPEVTIEDGTLRMDPPEPYIVSDEDYYLALDATGTITEIPEGYTDGMLLKENTIIIRSTETYQDTELGYDAVLNEFDIDFFRLDHDIITNWVQSFGLMIIIVSPLFIFVGLFISRLIAITFIAILGFIVMSALEQQDAFRKSFIVALYASIPVAYVNFVQNLIGKGADAVGITFTLGSICCLLPLIFSLIKWGIFWGLGAYGVNQVNGRKIRTPELSKSEDNGKTIDQGE